MGEQVMERVAPTFDAEHFYATTRVEGECLRWTGSVQSSGYPQYRDPATGQRVLARRWIYSKLKAPIPAGLVITSIRTAGCRYLDCVRLEHLEPVTQREAARRASAAQTHCKHDHEFTPENTYTARNALGYEERHCRSCRREASRRYQARKRAQENHDG